MARRPKFTYPRGSYVPVRTRVRAAVILVALIATAGAAAGVAGEKALALAVAALPG